MLRSRNPRLDETLCAEHPELVEEHQDMLDRASKCRSQEECAKINNEIRILRSRMLEIGFIKASLPAYRKYDPQSTFTPSAAVSKEEAEFYTEPAETADDVKEQEEVVFPEEKIALRFGRIWEKGGHRRVYFDEKAVAKAVGFELRSVRGTKRYFLEDDEYTNSAMAKLFQAFDGTYYDLNKKAFVSTSSKNDLLDSFKAVFAREVEVLHAVEQPEVEEENEGVDVSPEDTRYYDPALHINAHEVKALFRELCPHGKDSARLSIVDVTPGHADGEKYVICITHLGPDPHCPDVLARVCGEPLASSRMVWTGKEIASKYAIVFDRDAVEGLIKTWKESDPVRDGRAEETARKERAKVRREEQGA